MTLVEIYRIYPNNSRGRVFQNQEGVIIRGAAIDEGGDYFKHCSLGVLP